MRKLFVLVLLLLSTSAFAQAGTTEAGAAVAFPVFESGDLGTIDFEVTIDGNTGYGLTLNHFWTDRFSTELAAYSIDGDLEISENFVSEVAGKVELTVFTGTAQFHFLPASRFDPYVGAGVAHVSGVFDPLEAGDDDDDFESKIGFVGNAGIAVKLTQHLSLAGDIKYVPYSAAEEDEELAEEIDIDPTIFSLNLRFRF